MIEKECTIPREYISKYVSRALQKRLKITHIGFGLVACIFLFMTVLSKSVAFLIIGVSILAIVYIYMRAMFTFELQTIAASLRIHVTNNSISKYINWDSLNTSQQSKVKRSQTRSGVAFNQEIAFSNVSSITIKDSEIIVFTKHANTENEFGRITIPCEIESFEHMADFFSSNPDIFPKVNRK